MIINIGIHRLRRPGGRLAYTLSGTGPLVVAVPGMGDLRSVYRDIAEPIIRAGYRLAILDLRGHGDSDTSFTEHGDSVTGEDILALIDEHAESAVVIGNSMSASAAAWAAAERPDAVAGVVLLSPFLRQPATQTTQLAMRMIYRAVFARPWGAAFWSAYYGSLNRGTKAGWLKRHRAEIRRSLREPGRLRSLRQLAVQLDHSEVERRLASVTAPGLVLIGDQDPDFRTPQDELAWACAAINAEGMLVEKAGHYPQAQRPDVVTPRILSFLAAALPTSKNAAPEPTDG